MPSKKKKYNARFAATRIKKIMQSDEDIGKVAQAVPVIIYMYFKTIPRTLELFVESLLLKTVKITNSRNAKTLSPSHMKQCIMAENQFDFLRELVKNVPDICVAEDASNDSSLDAPSDTPYDLSMPSTSNSNETIRPDQKPMPSNGNSALLQSNNVTRSCGTTIVTNPQQFAKLNSGMTEECRKPFKRHWEAENRPHKSIQHSTSIVGITNRSNSVECVPPIKLSRSESAPTGSNVNELQATLSTLSTTLQHHKQQQLQQQQSNQVLPTDLRRVKHQTNCLPRDAGIVTAPSEINNINSKSPQTPTAIPASIVSTDFFNKPIVKIDYSNLALHDTSYSESPTSSSSSSTSPRVDINKNAKCIANTQIQTIPTTLATVAVPESPVINIDLSNIVTGGTISTSSNFAPVATTPTATIVISTPPQPPPPAPSSATASKQNSYLELDEDYDDI